MFGLKRVKFDDRGKRSATLRHRIEDACRLTDANRYSVVNQTLDQWKSDHPDYERYVDRMTTQAKHTAQAPFYSDSDIYTDLTNSLNKAKR
jgi:hypothetical protein